jgi:hypothetical protein
VRETHGTPQKSKTPDGRDGEGRRCVMEECRVRVRVRVRVRARTRTREWMDGVWNDVIRTKWRR